MLKRASKTLLASIFGISLAGQVAAADLSVIPQSVFNWGGFYAGAHLGGGWADSDISFTNGNATSPDGNGVLGGLQIGYNYMMTPQWLIGIEGDFTWTGIDGSAVCPNPVFACDFDVDWLASIRGRLGYVWDNVMLYGTVGVAFASTDYNAYTIATGVPFGPGSSVDQTGIAAGAGIAFALTPNLTGRVEYLYYGFDDEGVSAATFGVPGSADLNINTIRVGINYMFGNLY